MLKSVTESKINNFQILLFIKKQVFWLDISMCYAKLTEVLNTIH